ncbi:MAG: hypothetical protein JST17_00090 [Bacteroidetes bacterium]|nr:hypothetical protein [Bacteroidota bacterium]MBS1932214.1 hypothetical protein [Bacteroidota bacterium]
MIKVVLRRINVMIVAFLLSIAIVSAQESLNLKFKSSIVYSGIEVGSKGVKLSVVEIGKNARSKGAFNILKDSSVNTDFISFSPSTFHATLDALYGLYATATDTYKISPHRVFTVVSSGVKMQAEKENKTNWINNLIDSFKILVKDPARHVEVASVMEEARLSHLGIVPEEKRYSTFLIDIGSGNTKGGFFPDGTTKNFYLFQLNWGTKSTNNEADKRCENDKSLSNYSKQLGRVLVGAENSDIIYAVNASGAYPLSDYIAVSGGIAWSIATLLHPDQVDETIIPVTFDELEKFNSRLYTNFNSLSDSVLVKNFQADNTDKVAMLKGIRSVHKVFDQKSLMAGTGLLIKIMRQFVSVYETKQFFLIKNGQVGWISAYVDENVASK